MAKKKSIKISLEERRRLLKLLGVGSVGAMIPGIPGPFGWLTQAQAQQGQRHALVVVFFGGGYSGIWSSADSFLNNDFGVTQSNMSKVANGLFMDKAFIDGIAGKNGDLSDQIRNGIASLGVRHGTVSHGAAQQALMIISNRNPVLLLAHELSGNSPIKAANAGSGFTRGGRSDRELGISHEAVLDLKVTYENLTGTNSDLDRGLLSQGMSAAHKMSAELIARNPSALGALDDSYPTAVDILSKSANQSIDPNAIISAYNLKGPGVTNFTAQMAAAEMMISLGTNVVTVKNPGWDNHGDRDHSRARNKMDREILPGLGQFVQRNFARKDVKVNLLLIGDFARTTPGSNHSPGLAATVIGSGVKAGSTGRLQSTGRPRDNFPSEKAMWSYVAELTGANEAADFFGPNPHRSLLRGS